MSRKTRLLLAVVCGVAVASVYAGQPVLGPMGRDLDVPVDSLGWFVATGQLGYLAGLVLLVPLGDMLDRRRLIAAHLALVAAGTGLTAAAPVAWAAYSGLAVAGVFAVVVQTTVAYTASLSPAAERGRDLGIVISGVVIGILGSRIVAGVLADLWGWRSIYLTLAFLAAVLALLVLTLLPADVRQDTARYGHVLRSFGGLFVQPVFLSRGLIAFFLFASFGTLWSGMALPLADAPWHLGETQIGLFGIAGLAGALGAARSGRWGDAGHAHRVTGVALAALLASWAAIGQLPWSLPLLILGVLLLDFAVQAVHVSNQHTLTAAYPDRTSTTIGAYMVFYSLGSALGATATTALFEATAWPGPTVLGAALALCALATWAFIPRTRSPARPAKAEVTAPKSRKVDTTEWLSKQ
ncbi:MFS transporter [Actinomadura algeriensis]|uniref:MFS family arabinose efflux permease n=1 Tax=Actinomadura algeriensis TaxID=1679523 RepID=A0ABR9JPJ2_9ACTN|nr:MFS transporter [Actinomadura algeriensis]MBE1532493.1 putative MFS family arabinose efflux permease [Actinomadura algeriensis]